MRSIYLSCFLALSASFPIVNAWAADKHVHGEAELFIVVDGQQVMMELASPANNILGFENEPHSAEQEKRLQESLGILANYTHLVKFNRGGCEQQSSQVESPFKHHDDHKHAHTHEQDGDGHASFQAAYILSCKQIENITKMDIQAFEQFKGFEKITVNWVNNGKQGSQLATPTNKTIKLL